MTLNESSLERRFEQVSTSQGSIQSLSFFCLHYKNHHKRIAQIWLKSLQKAKVPHRLTLIYLANDIVQNAKRKNALSFIDDFKSILKAAIPYLRDDKIKKSVERVFSIWQDRSIFDSKFTIELKNSLNDNGRAPKIVSVSVDNSFNDPQTRRSTGDLMDSLNRLAAIEKNVENLRCAEDSVVDQLAEGSLPDKADPRAMADLRNYVKQLKSEVEERNKLAKLLEDSMIRQKRLLGESEEELNRYKSQLEHITKLRDDFR